MQAPLGVEDRRDVQAEVVPCSQLQDAAGRLPGVLRLLERAEVWLAPFGEGEDLEEGAVDRIVRDAGQVTELGVVPEDALTFRIDDGDPIGDGLQDLIRLQEHPRPAEREQLRGGHVDAFELLFPEQEEGPGHAAGLDDLIGVTEGEAGGQRGGVGLAIDHQDTRLLGHARRPPRRLGHDQAPCRSRPRRVPPDDRRSSVRDILTQPLPIEQGTIRPNA